MFPNADLITEKDIKLLLKEELNMKRQPRSLNTFWLFFVVYKLYYMAEEERFLEFLEDKTYYRTEEIKSNIHEDRTLPAYKLSFVSTSVLKNMFNVRTSNYQPYFRRFTKEFCSYEVGTRCRLFEWTEEGHKFFKPLVEAYFEERLQIPQDFKDAFWGRREEALCTILKDEPYYVKQWFNNLRIIHNCNN